MYSRILLVSIFTMCFSSLYSQPYNFEVEQGAYTDLQGSISLNENMTWDDPDFLIPIGFEFNYLNSSTENLLLTGLGTSLLLTLSFEDVIPIMFPFEADVIDRGYDLELDEPTTGSLSTISYLLDGSEGSRILKIEWKNIGFYSELSENGISNDFANLQLWLYEGSNNFEIHFGESSINFPDLSFDDFSGPQVLFDPTFVIADDELSDNALVLSGDPLSPDFSIGQINFEDSFLDGMIPNGTIYRFINGSTSINNQMLSNNQVELFPNPASNYLNFSLHDSNNGVTAISIVNMAGQRITQIANPISPIDISNLHPGLYIIEFYTNEGVSTKKLIKK